MTLVLLIMPVMKIKLGKFVDRTTKDITTPVVELVMNLYALDYFLSFSLTHQDLIHDHDDFPYVLLIWFQRLKFSKSFCI